MPRRAGNTQAGVHGITNCRPVELQAAEPTNTNWTTPKIPYTDEMRDAVYCTRIPAIIKGCSETQKNKALDHLIEAGMCMIGYPRRLYPRTFAATIKKARRTRVLDVEKFSGWGGRKDLFLKVAEIERLSRVWPLDYVLNAPLLLCILVLKFLRKIPNERLSLFLTRHEMWNKLPTAILEWESHREDPFFPMVCPPYASFFPEGSSMETYDELIAIREKGKSSAAQPGDEAPPAVSAHNSPVLTDRIRGYQSTPSLSDNRQHTSSLKSSPSFRVDDVYRPDSLARELTCVPEDHRDRIAERLSAVIQEAPKRKTDHLATKHEESSSTSGAKSAKVSRLEDGRSERGSASASQRGNEKRPLEHDADGSRPTTALTRVATRKMALISMALDDMPTHPSKQHIQVIRNELGFFCRRLVGNWDIGSYIEQHRAELELELADLLSC
ncbi:hypothetical protein XA68_16524 [Ophiocordyceps unilateralis]|uniref:Uncharacterized protein n=1 Tax=Ophiocordyceps unilateralis TaxID=268505 RepID=A0A2A9P4M0_OPHUN|nr:hypothetical protein XA68_16524 [Ophiocordyceps unilateralis]